MKTRTKPLNRDLKISKEIREVENKEQTARKRLENFARDSRTENKEQIARKELESFRRRSRPLEIDYGI